MILYTIFFKMDFSDEITKSKSKVFSLFSSFLTSRWSDLFLVILLLSPDNFASKSVFVIRFAWAILALKVLAANLLNSGVVMYSSCL